MESEVGPVLEVEKETRQIFTAVTLCFFFSGTTGLIYEVLWTRILGLVFGHTVFAITTVLSAFMAGLGLGSYLQYEVEGEQGEDRISRCVQTVLRFRREGWFLEDFPSLENGACRP